MTIDPLLRSDGGRWRRQYALSAAVCDLAAVTAAVLVYGVLGSSPHGRLLGGGLVVVVLTAVCLTVARAWDTDAAGSGAREFTRLLRGFLWAAVAIGLSIVTAGLEHGRPWVFAVLPAGAALAAGGRLWLRGELHRRRRAGQAMARVLAVGEVDAVAELVRRTRRVPRHGWLVDGVCTPQGAGPDDTSYVEEVHVVGDLDAVAALGRSGQFDVVAVGPVPGWTAERLRRLAWELEGTGTELAVDPGLVEVAGRRTGVRPDVPGGPRRRRLQPRTWRQP